MRLKGYNHLGVKGGARDTMNREQAEQMRKRLFVGVGEAPAGGMVVRDHETAWMLLRWADLMARQQCGDLTCEACEADWHLWWDLCNGLAGPTRIRMQKLMLETGIPLPAGPVTIMERHAVPTSLN